MRPSAGGPPRRAASPAGGHLRTSADSTACAWSVICWDVQDGVRIEEASRERPTRDGTVVGGEFHRHHGAARPVRVADRDIGAAGVRLRVGRRCPRARTRHRAWMGRSSRSCPRPTGSVVSSRPGAPSGAADRRAEVPAVHGRTAPHPCATVAACGSTAVRHFVASAGSLISSSLVLALHLSGVHMPGRDRLRGAERSSDAGNRRDPDVAEALMSSETLPRRKGSPAASGQRTGADRAGR